jgi:hypothetical protein
MAQRIQFREQEMREAIATMRRSAKELRDVIRQMQGVARNIENGALLGAGGEALQTAVQSTLCGSIDRLAQKLEERARFVEVELEQLLKAASQLR